MTLYTFQSSFNRHLTPSFIWLGGLCYFSYFMSAADLGLAYLGVVSLPPTIAAPVLIAPFLVLMLSSELLAKPPLGRLFARMKAANLVILAFFSVVAMSLLCACMSTAFWGENGKWIFLISFGFILFLLIFFVSTLPAVAAAVRPAAFISLLILSASMFWEVYHPLAFSGQATRAGGFAGNPNFGALALNMLCATALSYNASAMLLFDLLIFSVTGLGILTTQSRSGLLCFLTLFAFHSASCIIQEYRQRGRLARSLIGASLLLAGITLTGMYTVTRTDISATHGARLLGYLSQGSLRDDSMSSRAYAVTLSFELIAEAPVLGHGTGYARRMHEMPHNMYLQQWINNGIFGLAAFVTMILAAFYHFTRRHFPQGQALTLLAFLGSFFTHNLLDQRPFLLLFAGSLALSLNRCAAPGKTGRRKTVRQLQLPPLSQHTHRRRNVHAAAPLTK